MCGISGLVRSSCSADSLRRDIDAMVASLRHRGPDDRGSWLDLEKGVALGQTRLSILDLSPLGHQPMASASGRYQIVFNGEVYNYQQLVPELTQQGHSFRGHSDTEVMLAAIEEWGLESAVQRFNGMFAFALWDREQACLHLVRDRLGVKPLYYGWNQGAFRFGSELKALLAVAGTQAEVDKNVVALYMRHCYVPAPYSIYQGMYKLLPGTILSLSRAQLAAVPRDFSAHAKGAACSPQPYWSAEEAAARGRQQGFSGSTQDAIDQLDSLLQDSIRLRMISDVPLGAFLSGGIDSSLVVALMQAQSSKPVKTFTIGFHEAQFNEASYAKQVAQRLGTEHTELYMTAADCLAVVPRIPQIFDEPFADASQIPTYLVSQLARSKVTVSLSGDAGDELFAGYERYRWAQTAWSKLSLMPAPLRRALGKAILLPPKQFWDHACRAVFPILPKHWRFSLPGNKFLKLARVLEQRSSRAVYQQVVSHWDATSALVPGSVEPVTALTEPGLAEHWPLLEQMMLLDLRSYLPDDILVKVDRSSMAVGLEAREPLMDYRLVEFAWRLPLEHKLRGGVSKWILKQVLQRYLPPALFERPKTGFGVPIGSWLRHELRDWAEHLLDSRMLAEDGYLDPKLVRQKWNQHLAGTHDWEYLLWDLLMFQAWLHDSSRSVAAPALAA